MKPEEHKPEVGDVYEIGGIRRYIFAIDCGIIYCFNYIKESKCKLGIHPMLGYMFSNCEYKGKARGSVEDLFKVEKCKGAIND